MFVDVTRKTHRKGDSAKLLPVHEPLRHALLGQICSVYISRNHTHTGTYIRSRHHDGRYILAALSGNKTSKKEMLEAPWTQGNLSQKIEKGTNRQNRAKVTPSHHRRCWGLAVVKVARVVAKSVGVGPHLQ